MRRNRAWEIGATAALSLVVGVTAVNGYSWHLRRQTLNARFATELDKSPASTAAIHRLLSQGADIRRRDSYGDTVLTAAARADDLSLAKLALDSGVPLEVPGYGTPALFAAAGNGSSRMVELLLARGAMPNDRAPSIKGITPLMVAADWCKPTTVRTLLSAGADASLRDDTGKAALDYARSSRSDIERDVGRAETIRLLKDALARKRTGPAPRP